MSISTLLPELGVERTDSEQANVPHGRSLDHASSTGAFLNTSAASNHSPSAPGRSPFVLPDREALYADFQPLVRRLIRQYGEDGEMRQDLEGEIYCRFCDLLAAFDPTRGIPLRPYLVRTLTASVYTYTRSQWRRQHRERTMEAGLDVGEALNAPDPSEQWDRDMMMQEVLKTLPAAIAQLPLRQRQVVVWRYYESRSFEEIAETLRVRPATARSLLRHGLNNLRRRVALTNLTVD